MVLRAASGTNYWEAIKES